MKTINSENDLSKLVKDALSSELTGAQVTSASVPTFGGSTEQQNILQSSQNLQVRLNTGDTYNISIWRQSSQTQQKSGSGS